MTVTTCADEAVDRALTRIGLTAVDLDETVLAKARAHVARPNVDPRESARVADALDRARLEAEAADRVARYGADPHQLVDLGQVTAVDPGGRPRKVHRFVDARQRLNMYEYTAGRFYPMFTATNDASVEPFTIDRDATASLRTRDDTAPAPEPGPDRFEAAGVTDAERPLIEKLLRLMSPR